jgi:hypothetical protein
MDRGAEGEEAGGSMARERIIGWLLLLPRAPMA